MAIADTQQHLTALHAEFARRGLRGLWQRGGDRGGEKPSEAKTNVWRWTEMLPILEQSLKLVRLPEDTDQRVIGLTGGGSALSLAYQLMNPGESVASHRHTPAQMRFVVEGRGATTTSDGEPMVMEPGDLLVQPNWSWHGTENLSEGPSIWLDIQDRNLINYLGAFLRELWPDNTVQPATRPAEYHRRAFGALQARAPIERLPAYRYRWSDTLEALEQLCEASEPDREGVFEFKNPATGGHTLPTMSVEIQVLRPGEVTRCHRRTGTAMVHVIEGEGVSQVGAEELQWNKRDCFVIPPLQWQAHRNLSSKERALLFCVSDRPILEALGLYREENE
ncbi:MAG TPA: cupin domain-containing protein [Candidatus Binatia bacterium]|jgi:gentisate 1,2-dioxygenase